MKWKDETKNSYVSDVPEEIFEEINNSRQVYKTKRRDRIKIKQIKKREKYDRVD